MVYIQSAPFVGFLLLTVREVQAWVREFMASRHYMARVLKEEITTGELSEETREGKNVKRKIAIFLCCALFGVSMCSLTGCKSDGEQTPTPMAFSELFVGLEQHTVNAQENPYEIIVSNKFYEVQDYVIETNHLPHLLALVTNEDFYQNLTEEQRAIVDEAATNACANAREQAVERTDSRIEEIVTGGGDASKTAEIVEVSEELRTEMREASSELYEEIRAVVDFLYIALMEDLFL